jgi:thiamine pyrophosphokinase
MRAVIISGGSITEHEFIKAQIKPSDTIICADSGYSHAVKMGLAPSIVVGDFDSIGEMPCDVECLRYPSKKDLTDTEIAMEYARDKGFKDFLLIAATGSRLDHSLTNILLLKDTLQRGEKAIIINENNKVMITDSKLLLHEPPGSIVSLVPLSDCRGVTTENLEYPLHGAEMLVGKGLGVSNIMVGDSAAVTISRGLLLVIVAKD